MGASALVDAHRPMYADMRSWSMTLCQFNRMTTTKVEQNDLIETLTVEKNLAVKDTQAGTMNRMTYDQRLFAEGRRRKAEVDAAWLRDEVGISSDQY